MYLWLKLWRNPSGEDEPMATLRGGGGRTVPRE